MYLNTPLSSLYFEPRLQENLLLPVENIDNIKSEEDEQAQTTGMSPLFFSTINPYNLLHTLHFFNFLDCIIIKNNRVRHYFDLNLLFASR